MKMKVKMKDKDKMDKMKEKVQVKERQGSSELLMELCLLYLFCSSSVFSPLSVLAESSL